MVIRTILASATLLSLGSCQYFDDRKTSGLIALNSACLELSWVILHRQGSGSTFAWFTDAEMKTLKSYRIIVDGNATFRRIEKFSQPGGEPDPVGIFSKSSDIVCMADAPAYDVKILKYVDLSGKTTKPPHYATYRFNDKQIRSFAPR